MKPFEITILRRLSQNSNGLSLEQITEDPTIKIDRSSAASVLEKLSGEKLATLEKKEQTTLVLTEEGKKYSLEGTPEARLVAAVGIESEMPAAVAKAKLSLQEQPIALQWAMRKKLLSTQKQGDKTMLKSTLGKAEDLEKQALEAISAGKTAEPAMLQTLRQRKLVEDKVTKQFFAKITSAGKAAITETAHDEISQLTPQMLKSGDWKGNKFSEYGLSTVVAPMQVARKHPYKEFLQRIKEKLVGLGFREVRGSLAEIEFWNLDALYMPQDHPARQIHDVFFVKQPGKKLPGKAGGAHGGHYAGEIAPPEVFQDVFNAHKHGGNTGSRGWQYQMSKDISSRVILRSHDTGISARELFKKLSPPDRVFFIAHVFRPDEIDWKHFIEFNQLGGYVADQNTSFRDLLGTLKTFAEEVFQAEKVKFVPSYFPFTEPSVEVYAKIPGRGWAEVGGAGLFRPELLEALGIDYPVIAWGLGIDRLAMLSIGINDIRELHSHNIPFLQGK